MIDRHRVSGRRLKWAAPMVAVLALAGASVARAGPAVAAGSPIGSACGYFTNVSLFGGPASLRGCGQTIPPGTSQSASPSVKLPAGGSTTVIAKADNNGALAQYGPAYIFSGRDTDPSAPGPPPSGKLKVTTTGTTKVVSTALVMNIGPNPFTADSVKSSCTATATKHSWTATVSNGVVATATDANGDPTTTVPVPNPTPANTTINGKITNVGDSFKIVFNEHVANADGTFTVNGAHMYLLGPTAVGDMVIAQSRCGH